MFYTLVSLSFPLVFSLCPIRVSNIRFAKSITFRYVASVLDVRALQLSLGLDPSLVMGG